MVKSKAILLLSVLLGSMTFAMAQLATGTLTMPADPTAAPIASDPSVAGNSGSSSGSSSAGLNAQRVFNNEFHDMSIFGFHSFSVTGSLNLRTTCPGQNGNTLNQWNEPQNCTACPCNLPAQFVASLCVDPRRISQGFRVCTLAFVGAVGGIAVRAVSPDEQCRITVARHGEVNITSRLIFNPQSIGGITLPMQVTLHIQLISESKFVVSSSGEFMFAGIGERAIRRFNPFFRMKRLRKGHDHGPLTGGLGGSNPWLNPGVADIGSAGVSAGGLGGDDGWESDADFLSRRDAFITNRFRNFRCPSVSGLITVPDARINDNMADDDWGRFDRDDETCVGAGNHHSDFADFNGKERSGLGNGNCNEFGDNFDDWSNGNGRLNNDYTGGGQ